MWDSGGIGESDERMRTCMMTTEGVEMTYGSREGRRRAPTSWHCWMNKWRQCGAVRSISQRDSLPALSPVPPQPFPCVPPWPVLSFPAIHIPSDIMSQAWAWSFHFPSLWTKERIWRLSVVYPSTYSVALTSKPVAWLAYGYLYFENEIIILLFLAYNNRIGDR